MLISLNWLKDFLDIPASVDPNQLALRFTTTVAEVEGVEHHKANFSGLVAARIDSVERVPGEEKLRRVTLTADRSFTTLSAGPDLSAGDVLIYGPPGASVAGHPFAEKDPAGRPSQGMIVAGQALGLVQVGANALFLPPDTKPGSPIDGALFDDWLIEIDNKSITHRPDLWGHYGVARELAAMLGTRLRPYDVSDVAELSLRDLPAVPIEIDDPALCPRYTALVMKGLKPQPSPLWMQVRLALVGMRPIDLLVDLTNYVMAELGQPMHAFDGAKLRNIQVALAKSGEKFTTLDGLTRTMPPHTLMIQSDRKSVAIAGIMGGAETEVSEKTDTVLLESANFDAPTIRKAATAMGHRTEASARFEKSLDPAHTVLGIARFHKLAKAELPALSLASTMSDCYPTPKTPQPIELDCDYAARFIGRRTDGRPITPEEMAGILTAIDFKIERRGNRLLVTPPSYRATKDISIEADLIEEIARFIGYDNIEPALPRVASRHFQPSADLIIEAQTLDYLCVGNDFTEVHDYIWFDDAWVRTLDFDPGPCITLQNPAAEGASRLRTTLVPGMIAFAERNRHNYDRFQLAQIGSVFAAGRPSVEHSQHRSLALLVAQSGAKADAVVWERLRSALDGWARQVLEDRAVLGEAKPVCPWEDADRLAQIELAGRDVGRITILPLAFKLRIDERLRAWSIAVAELDVSALADLTGRHEKLPRVPRFPQVQLDFSVLIPASDRYSAVSQRLAGFRHPLLKRLSFVDAYEGKSIPAGKRGLTFRAEIGAEDRTLGDADVQDFQTAFRSFLSTAGMELRS